MKWVGDRTPTNPPKIHIFIFPTLWSKFRGICKTLFHSLSYTPTCRGFLKVFSLFCARKYVKWKIALNESMTRVIEELGKCLSYHVRFVCCLGFKCSNILWKEKLHFVHMIIEFFNVQAFWPSPPNIQTIFSVTHFKFWVTTYKR